MRPPAIHTSPFASATASICDSHSASGLGLVSVLALTGLALLASTAAHADEAPGASIYQQRKADGSVLLTDRPSAGAVTQRTWRVEPPDAGAAQRREAARQDAAEVTRRIGQRLEADDRRAQELTLARVRAAEAQARLNAESTDADTQTAWIVGPRLGAYSRRGGAGWNALPGTPQPSSTASFNSRPATATIVRGIPLRADGFPAR